MQIVIIQTEAADFVKIYICVILKTFGHDCTYCNKPGKVPNSLHKGEQAMSRLSLWPQVLINSVFSAFRVASVMDRNFWD